MNDGERFCPFCGRANPAAMLRCSNCGQRMTRAEETGTGAGTALRFQSVEEQTLRAPWWQTGDTQAVPPPPQVRDEARRHALREIEVRERETQNRARYDEYLVERERLRQARLDAEAELDGTARTVSVSQTTLVSCPSCGTALGEAGRTFSFCLHCGSDIAQATSKAARRSGSERTFTQATSAGTAQTIRAATVGVEARAETRYTESAPQKGRTVAPGVAGVLSFFLPGVGQILNGQTAKGVLTLLVFLVLIPLLHWHWLGIIVQGAAALDAFRIARRRREGEPVLEDEWDLGQK